MVQMVIFYLLAGASAYSAETKRWGWCVFTALLALRNAAGLP